MPGILVGGTSPNAFGLVRLTPEGNLDSTFGTGGRVRTVLSTAYPSQQYYDMALQGDGKIVAVGQIDDGYQLKNKTYVHNMDQLLVRYNADGSLDTTFGNGGIVRKDFSTYDNPNDSMNMLDVAQGVAIQPDGKIVVGGRTMVGSNVSNAILVRYNTDGSTLDTTFGTGGKVIVQSTTPGGFYTPWLQADGKIVASGFGTIARFNSDGTPDDGSVADSTPLDAFGTGGMVLQHANVGAIQPDGKILTVGTSSNGVNDDIIVYRLNPDGTADTNFGIGGAARIDGGATRGQRGPPLRSVATDRLLSWVIRRTRTKTSVSSCCSGPTSRCGRPGRAADGHTSRPRNPRSGGRWPNSVKGTERVRKERKKAAGELSPPSAVLTGPAKLRRSHRVAGTMAPSADSRSKV